MRTSIDLPDDLWRRAKAEVGRRSVEMTGTHSLKSLVREALEGLLSRPSKSKPKRGKHVAG